MSKSYRPYYPEQDLLLPPSLREWLPENHLVYFVQRCGRQSEPDGVGCDVWLRVRSRETRRIDPRLRLGEADALAAIIDLLETWAFTVELNGFLFHWILYRLYDSRFMPLEIAAHSAQELSASA